MRFFEDYKVDGKPIVAPDADVVISKADLDSADSGRDESGVMHRIVVRYRVKTWELSYANMTTEEYQYMSSLFAGKSEFQFTYRDLSGQIAGCTAYCSNDSITYHNARTGMYRNYKIKIIEC